jgi:hypothetical protein
MSTRGRLGDGRLGSGEARAQVRLPGEIVGRRPDLVFVGHDGVPHRGVAALAWDDEHRGRPGALAVHVQRAAVADVEQACERGVARLRGTTPQ